MCDACHASPAQDWWMLRQSLATAGAISKAYVRHTPNSRRTTGHQCRVRHLRTSSSRCGASGSRRFRPRGRPGTAGCRRRKPRRPQRATRIGAVLRALPGLAVFRSAVLRAAELPAAARVGSQIPFGKGLSSARSIGVGHGLSSQRRGRRADRRHHRLAAIGGVSNARSSARPHVVGIGRKHRITAGGQERRPVSAVDEPPHEPRRGHPRSARSFLSRDRDT